MRSGALSQQPDGEQAKRRRTCKDSVPRIHDTPKPDSVPVLLAFLVLLAAPREVFGVPVFCLKSAVVVWVEAQLDVNAAGTLAFVRGVPQRQ